MNYMVLGKGYLAFFVNMVMNFEVLYKTHNFLTPRMTVIYAFRVLIIIKRLHSSGHTHTHTRDSLRVVKWVLNFLNRGPNYWVRVFVRDRRVFFVLSGALIMQTTLLPTEQVYYCTCHAAGRVVAVTLFVILIGKFHLTKSH
jgi:hypothetical protein